MKLLIKDKEARREVFEDIEMLYSPVKLGAIQWQKFSTGQRSQAVSA